MVIDTEIVAAIIASLGMGGVVTGLISSVVQRRKLGADATSVVTAAARELVDPLRKELAIEREEHAMELEHERVKVQEVRANLDSMVKECNALRGELAAVRHELDEAWGMVAAYKRVIRELGQEDPLR